MMRVFAIVLTVLLCWVHSFSQQRYLISQESGVTVLKPGESAAEKIRKNLKVQAARREKSKNGRTAAPGEDCTPERHFGFTEKSPYFYYEGEDGLDSSQDANLGFFPHKDIVATWFEVPATGTIDSVFLSMGPYVGDEAHGGGKVIVSLHRSAIHTGSGPGWGNYLAPPWVFWGYYDNANDLDNGLAAFEEDATDPTWHSMYSLNNDTTMLELAGITFPWYGFHLGSVADVSMESFPPALEQLWGLGGVGVNVVRDSLLAVPLATLGKPHVEKGTPIFISFQCPGAHPADVGTAPPFTDPTLRSLNMTYSAGGILPYTGAPQTPPLFGQDTSIEVRRSFHSWKFHEHRWGRMGWVARGGLNYSISYSMTVTSDVPPVVESMDQLGNILEGVVPQQITADITDCNFENTAAAGVASASLHYKVNSGADHSVAMTNIGGSIWKGVIPPLAAGSTVSYYVTAVDVNNNTAHGRTVTFNILPRKSDWYGISPESEPLSASILHSGVEIDTAEFFGPRVPLDDGTAGPFAISNGFLFFGDTMHYAWVGVNGQLALSKSATDTILVTEPHVLIPSRNPRNLIAPFPSDFMIGDGSTTAGHIVHQDSADRFVVEWDSLGLFDLAGLQKDATTFRVALNKADGTIEFQYDNVGTHNKAAAITVGLQSDSTNALQQKGYMVVNTNSNPPETTPRNGSVIKLWPVQSLTQTAGWNLVSTPGSSWSYAASLLYPNATSAPFSYIGSYKAVDSLVPGPGYWLKFVVDGTSRVVSGYKRQQDVELRDKWNIIGSLTGSFPKANLTTTPPGLITTTAIYGYSGGYSADATTIDPGKGYWVKSSGAGTLHFNTGGSAFEKNSPVDDYHAMNMISIGSGSSRQQLFLAAEGLLKNRADSYELPPPAPDGFDARFSSGRMAEIYGSGGAEYRINVNAGKEPLTISWSMKNTPEGRTFTMTDGNSGKILGKVILQGTGSVRIENANVTSLVIRSESGIAMPKNFALSQNYPNPFNPTTHMQLEVPHQAQVTVAVYDVLGRLVTTLVNGVQEAGYHTIEWNGHDAHGVAAPSGTYFVRLNAGEFSDVKKVMIMK